MYCAHDRLAQFGIVMLILPHPFAQVFRPLWPFFAASGITYYLVSTAQDTAVRCASFCLTSKSANSHPLFPPPCFPFTLLAEAFRNDPRNPYAAQIAKEAHAHH